METRRVTSEPIQPCARPRMRSDLPIAGFAVIEAKDLQEAIASVAKVPCAVAYGVVEVWPLHIIRPSFRRKPESRFSEHELDPGFRRDDGAFEMCAWISLVRGGENRTDSLSPPDKEG